MPILKSSFLTLLITFIASKSFSQSDTILMLNGNIVITNIIDTTGGSVSFKNPKHPNKNIVLDNDRIFSITNSKGEFLYYVFDSIIGNEFTIDEMRYFIKGEQDAEKGFKARGAFWGGFAIGYGSGILGTFLSPVAPFAFSLLVGIPKIKIKKGTVSNLENLTQESYVMGYERVARGKRKLKSLVGGGIGLGLGIGSFAVLKANGYDLIK